MFKIINYQFSNAKHQALLILNELSIVKFLKLKLVDHWLLVIDNSRRSRAGFSIPEALITISVIGVIGLVLTGLIGRAYQGNTKTELIGNIKQNGQSALSSLDKNIRDASSVVCTATTPDPALVVQTQEGKFIRFYMKPPISNQNGFIMQQNSGRIDPNDNTLCDTSKSFPFSENFRLTDWNSKNAVSVKNGTFAVNKSAGFKDTVTISFEIGPDVNSGTSYDTLIGGTSNSIKFETTVQLR